MDFAGLMRGTQRGAIMPLFVVGLVAIIGIAGLALDMGHAYLDKTRLQNVLDAAALSGAKVLMETKDTEQAEAAARATFASVVASSGELASADMELTVEMSDTLVPFVPGGTDPSYVRVKVDNLSMSVALARVLPGVGDTLTIGGSAVAGPSPPLNPVCNIAPLLACADPSDTDCSDDACFGYPINEEEETVLKSGAGDSNWEVGPGNFQLIQLGCGSGADCVRENLAGGYDGCIDPGGTVPTEPGNVVGPVAQGLNTRFGMYQGPLSQSQSEYPPDIITKSESEYWWQDYLGDAASGYRDYPEPIGVPQRRVLAIPFGICTGETNGSGDVQVVGIGCFFLTQPAEQSGEQRVYGQFIGQCETSGSIPETPVPSGVLKPYKIILYKDPDNQDS